MAQQPFDPNQFISKVKGNDYLEVKWRIAWMRSEHPDAIMETELVSHDEDRAIMRASVIFPDGGSATGWGSETAASFENYIEKAETKAIGRALTALGYGTPISEPEESEQFTRDQRSPARPAQQPNAFLATAAQKARIQRLAGDLHSSPAELDTLIHNHVGSSVTSMNKRQASGVIDMLEARRPLAQQAS